MACLAKLVFQFLTKVTEVDRVVSLLVRPPFVHTPWDRLVLTLLLLTACTRVPVAGLLRARTVLLQLIAPAAPELTLGVPADVPLAAARGTAALAGGLAPRLRGRFDPVVDLGHDGGLVLHVAGAAGAVVAETELAPDQRHEGCSHLVVPSQGEVGVGQGNHQYHDVGHRLTALRTGAAGRELQVNIQGGILQYLD